MSLPRGSFRVRLAAIVAGAVALRLLYVLVLARYVPMAGDAQFFHLEANLIADGKGYVEPFLFTRRDVVVPTAAHPPLYSTVLAGVSLLGGDGVLSQRAFGALLGGVTVVLVALVGRRLGGDRLGLVAGTLAALYPLFVTTDGAPLSESLYALLIAAILLVALVLLESRRVGVAAGLGALIGLAALTRSEALLLVVLIGLPLALTGPRERRWLRALALCAACAAVLAPWTIRNWSAFDGPTLISHNDAAVLAGANCPLTYGGRDLGSWRYDCISLRRTFQERRQAARWRREGLDYARDHAGRWPVVVPVRVLRTWDLWQPGREIERAEGRTDTGETIGVAVYYLALPLALAGALLLRSRNRGALAILLAPALLVTLVSAAGYGVPRFRQAFEPSLVVLAAVALVAIGERLAQRRRASPPAAAVGAR
jgi:4-amino-4-deoxy-L-arabinose transferase-like glycosyltransferase